MQLATETGSADGLATQRLIEAIQEFSLARIMRIVRPESTKQVVLLNNAKRR